MRKRSLLAAFSLCFIHSAAWAIPRGFLAPEGGGAVWLDGENGVPVVHLETRTLMHQQVLAKLAENRALGATVGASVCAIKQIVSSAEDPQQNTRYFQYLEQSFRLAGLGEGKFLSFEFPTRIEASAVTPDYRQQLNRLSSECGIVYLPGGDQTQMRDLWKGTPLHAALESVIARGGGLMGNSAGAAILGSLIFFPGANDITSTRGLLELNSRNRDAESAVVLENGMFTGSLRGFPKIYFETHTEPRERVARAAALLAAWETDQSTSDDPAIAIALDTDAAVLVSWDSRNNAWVGEVAGGRSAEFLFPTTSSRAGWPRSGLPYYTHLKSHLMLHGGKVILSGPRRGQVLNHSVWGRRVSGSSTSTCYQAPMWPVHGDTPQETWDASAFHLTGVLPDGTTTRPDWFKFDPAKPDETSPNLFRGGDLRFEPGVGCGYWQPFAFHADRGHSRDRLPAARFALGQRLADFMVALPIDMFAAPLSGKNRSETATVELRGLSEEQGGRYIDSSVFVYDARSARQRGVATYIYSVYGHNAPVQIGMWEDATVHLLAPGSRFDLSTGAVSLFPMIP